MKKLSALMVIALLSGFVVAQLGIPHQFYGSVDFLDGPAPDGLTVEARIDGVKVAESVTLNGKYGYNPKMFFVTDPNNNRAGKTIKFYVNGVDTGESYVFENGASTLLDLSVPLSVPVSPTTTLSSGGGTSRRSGGGGGGGGGGVGGAKPVISCFDGIKNCHDGSCETDVDCGGPCDPCMNCSDGILNQGEEGVDCGGPCGTCPSAALASVSSTTMSSTTIPAGSTSSTVPATSTTAGVVSSVSSTTRIEAPAVGNVLAEAGGPVPIVVLFFLLFFVGYYVFRGGK